MDWWDLFAAAAGTSWACVRAGTVLGASLAVVAARHSVGAGLWLLGVAAWPVTTTLGILLFIVSPAVYMAQYTMSPVFWTMGVIPKLEALYIFFGCAACLGILAGTALRLTSSIVATTLGMNETAGGGGSAHADGDRRHRRTESELSELSSVSAATKFNSLGSSSPRGDWSASAAGDGRLRWGDKGFSSQESSDPLYWPTADQKRLVAAADRQQQPQKQPQKQKGAVSGSKRKGKQSMPGLLQQQTILEEDDS